MDTEVLKRLIRGEPLDGLGLHLKDGRIDLSGLVVPEPVARRTIRTAIADVVQLNVITVRGAAWRRLDFTGSRLNGLRLFDCGLSDCVFDKSSCQGWRIWSTTITDTSFRSTDLRGSALGAVQEGKRNVFRNVDFAGADLRQSSYVATEFTGCTFKHTRLNKVDFQTSAFTNCEFTGELQEVLFYRRGFKGEAFPPNEMDNVSFAGAKLRWVEFRGLDMTNVLFPQDDDHIIVDDYPSTVERLVGTFEGKDDLASRRLAVIFRMKRKWAGAGQRRGVLNKNDLLELGGEEGLRRVLDALASRDSGCERMADDG